MASPFSLRLDEATRRQIERMARRRRASASDIVRSAIESLAHSEESRVEPYKLVADLIGAVRGRNPRRSEGTGRRFTKLLKRARRAR
jgi:predicted transcriptional regulator